MLIGGLTFVLVVAGASCGGRPGKAAGISNNAAEKTDYPPGPTREFIIPGGDNTVQRFGHEAPPSEREEASGVIHHWMRARVARNWIRDCKYLSRRYVEVIVKDARGVSEGKATTCAAALDFVGPLASGKLVNTLTGPIDSFRVQGRRAYAQYHGRRGVDWVIPMEEERGQWWVALAGPINRRQ